jgi:hypothetical protein
MQKILYFHSDPSEVIRSTIAGKVENDKIVFSAARCSEKDQFEKSIGRKIAERRLNQGKVIATVPATENPTKKFLKVAPVFAVMVNFGEML